MSTLEDTTMAEMSDKTMRFKLISRSKKNKKAKDGVVNEGKINHSFIYPMQILMTANDPGTKKTYMARYNLMPKTKTLLLMMAELDPGLSITLIDGKSTLLNSQDTFPNTEAKFKQFFM